ncbi:MAG: carboxymuconolactone decarboxylase family protein [Pseudomonadota bacterium]
MPSAPTSPPQRTYEERRARATESFRRFVPEAEPQRVADSFANRLGPLGTFAFEVVGDMWDRPALSRRDRSLFIISTLAAQARDEELVGHTQIGIRHGLTRTEIEEILPHVAAYAGFPAAMAASRHIDEGLRQSEDVERLSKRIGAPPKDDSERDNGAAQVLATLANRAQQDASADLTELTTQYGYLGEWGYRWVMGEIWSRPELSVRDRLLVTLSILISLGALRMLTFYIESALYNGLSQVEIEELISHLGLYAGMPRAIDAMDVAREVFEAQK